MVVKKLFTLIAVTALTGLVAAIGAGGCSSDDAPTAATTDSGTSGSTDAKKETGIPITGDDETADDGSTATPNCPVASFKYSEADIVTQTGAAWEPPIQTKDACTDAEITAFGKALTAATQATAVADIVKDVGAGCKSCLFSTSTDKNWQLLVAIPGADNTAGFLNYGACHAAETKSNDCGKDYQYNQFCVNSACSGCDTTNKTDCTKTVWGTNGACATIDQAKTTACGDTTTSACGNTALTHAAFLCGNGDTDGGLDAGQDAD